MSAEFAPAEPANTSVASRCRCVTGRKASAFETASSEMSFAGQLLRLGDISRNESDCHVEMAVEEYVDAQTGGQYIRFS